MWVPELHVTVAPPEEPAMQKLTLGHAIAVMSSSNPLGVTAVWLVHAPDWYSKIPCCPTAKQSVVEGQEIAFSDRLAPLLTETGQDQALPLSAIASPALSTVMQNVEPGAHETADGFPCGGSIVLVAPQLRM